MMNNIYNNTGYWLSDDFLNDFHRAFYIFQLYFMFISYDTLWMTFIP